MHVFRTFSVVLAAVAALAAPTASAQFSAPWQRAVISEAGAMGNALTVDALGNRYVTGMLLGACTFGAQTITSAGAGDIFVAKLDSADHWLWAVAAGGPGQDRGSALTVDARTGDVYLTGQCGPGARFGATTLPGTQARPFVAKLSPAGQWQWVRDVACLSGHGRSLAAAPGGGVFVSGEVAGAATFGTVVVPNAGGDDGFVARLSDQGQWQWVSPIGGSGFETAHGLAADAAGHVFIAGSFSSPTLTLGATTLANPTTQPAVLVARLDAATGQWQWGQRALAHGVLAPTGQAAGTALAVDGSGEVYVGGTFNGGLTLDTTHLSGLRGVPFQQTDLFVARLSADGQRWQWGQAGGSALEDDIETMAFAPNTMDLYVVGAFGISSGPSSSNLNFDNFSWLTHGASDAFALRLDTTGRCREGWFAGGTDTDLGRGLGFTPTGKVVVAGTASGVGIGFERLLLPGIQGSGVFVGVLGARRPAGLPETSDAGFGLYPNPAHGTVQISGALGPTAEIIDALGRKVQTSHLAPQTSNLLDLQGLTPGLYVVRCGGAGRRLVVE